MDGFPDASEYDCDAGPGDVYGISIATTAELTCGSGRHWATGYMRVASICSRNRPICKFLRVSVNSPVTSD